MKRIRIIVLLFIVFILTGCSGTYNININDNLTVKENLDIVIPTGEETRERVLKLFEDNKIDHDSYKIVSSADVTTIKYTEEYVSIEDYIINSKIYKMLFDEIDFEKDKTKYSINTKDVFDLSGNNSDYDISLLQVNIQTPFKVVNTNADTNSDNTMSWVLDKNTTSKSIRFAIDVDSRKYAIQYIVPIIVIGVIIIIFIWFLASRSISIKKI